MVIAAAPMMFDWMVKKLKKFTTLLPMLMVLRSWVMIAATTAAAISSRSARRSRGRSFDGETRP